jgi:hypothetical protein
MEKSLSPLVSITTSSMLLRMASYSVRYIGSTEKLYMLHIVVKDGSGILFQIRNISYCSMLLRVTSYTVYCFKSGTVHFTVGECFIHCQVCCINTLTLRVAVCY